MSSHLLPVYFTTTRYNRKKKKAKFKSNAPLTKILDADH